MKTEKAWIGINDTPLSPLHLELFSQWNLFSKYIHLMKISQVGSLVGILQALYGAVPRKRQILTTQMILWAGAVPI